MRKTLSRGGWRCAAVLGLLAAVIIGGCGVEPAASPPLPTDAVQTPTAGPPPTEAVRVPTAPPLPSDTPTPLAQPAEEVADAFLAALRDGDYSKAYDLCDPRLQAVYVTAEALGEWLLDNELEPLEWTFSSQVEGENSVELQGNALLATNQEVPVELVLSQVEGQWRVIDVFFGYGLEGSGAWWISASGRAHLEDTPV